MLDSLKKNSFVILGRAGMDFYADPPGTRTEKATSFFAALGGSSANIAVAIARHGGAAALVTAVSDDAVGRFVRNQLEGYGVNADGVRTTGGQSRTSLAVVETRIQDCQSVIYRNGAADFEFSTDDLAGIEFRRYGGLIATGTCFAAEPSRSATFTAFEAAKDAGIPVILDLDYRPYTWPSPADAGAVCLKAAEMADIVVGNDEEFATLAGDMSAGRSLAQDLARNGNRLVVYKMGAQGSVTFQGTQVIEAGIYRVEALKPTGSGDAFLGSFISALAQGHPLEVSLERGSAAAAMVVSKVGCAPAMPDTAQLDEFIRTHPGPTRTMEADHAHPAL
ncbi:5-dehydro-2-deoxygluconokinase [Hoeflea poritis]|uniref:5-dehydro-2-deoxygluconokinase n=1 Tax=Hoeflea poritis TaxID=2993659 RepID=A0ABT4VIM9_9HYPH|nr:5-dehydro-2-deoxygluconokinase [Hoeflea poritis]MDA4844536.1 5-dehydro-2-deoxygluconokinase [Hoeflea poritis]